MIPGGVQTTERIVRFMASEPRVRRRMLSQAINGLLAKTAAHVRASRTVAPSRPGDPYYVFLLLPKPVSASYEDYRAVRSNLLNMYCQVVRLKWPDAMDIVGIATEPGYETKRSEDAAYLDARDWTEENQHAAESCQADFHILTSTTEFRSTVKEYPDVEPGPGESSVKAPGKNPRNKLCPCGSGQKWKKCHGR